MKKTAHLLVIMSLLFSFSFTAFAADEETTGHTPNVNTVSVAPLNGGALITWDAVTDEEHGISGYKVYYGTQSVNKDSENKDYENFVEVGNVTEYKLTGLQNDTTYYFSVISVGNNGEESEKWSFPEGSATPSAEIQESNEDDTTAPTVTDAEAVYKDTVKVTFSEPITIPETDPQDAFSIMGDVEPIYVTAVEYDTDDDTEKTVLLTTDVQEKNMEYTLTVGTDISDKAGNNIISGTSDTGIFTGVDIEKPAGDVEAPIILDAKSTSSTTILVNFNETVSLSVDPTKDFVIKGIDDENEVLEVTEVILGKNTDGTEFASAIITTSEQKNITYTILFNNIKDLSGNVVTDQTRIFTGIEKEEEPDTISDTNPDTNTDTTAPKDIAKLIAKSTVALTKFDVNLSWTLPLETEDLASQTIYMSKGSDTNFKLQTTLDNEATSYEMKDLTAGEYYFKHTQTDVTGNESEGTITKVSLSETGPGMVGLLLFSLGAGQLSRRKKFKF